MLLVFSLFLNIYIYIYIVIQRQTVSFYQNSSVWHWGRSKPGSKALQLYVRLNLRPLGQKAYHIWLREFLRYLFSNSSSSRLLTFIYPIGYQSVQFFRRALHYASGGRKFLQQSAQPPWGSGYIVIYRQTVSFYQNSSVWLYIYIYIWTSMFTRLSI